MRLSPATLADIPALLPIGEQFWRTTGMIHAGLNLDLDSLTATLTTMMHEPNQVLFVVKADGVIVGVVGGFITPAPFNNKQSIAQESFWYVLPEHRRGGVGQALYDTFEAWAKAKGATALVMATIGNKKLHEYYLAHGFHALESHYFKAL
ncbi:MAG: GNAT family N-acetyltransferase [Nitrososphaera sp.]